MALQSIARHTGTNVPGGCYLDYVDTSLIDSFPEERDGNLDGTITLLGSATFTRIVFDRFDGAIEDGWKRVGGSMVSVARLPFAVSKDDINKLPGFWELQHGRYVVLLRTRNDQTLCLGTKNEGAQFETVKRGTGRANTDFSGYELVQFSATRRKPVPFYLGTPPEVSAGSGGTGSLTTITGTAGTLGTPDDALITVL